MSLPRLMGLWASLAAGLLGLLYVVTAGVARAVAGRTRWLGRDSIPALGVLALTLPIPFFTCSPSCGWETSPWRAGC